MRMKTGNVEDLDTALDLKKIAGLIDKVGALFEEEGVTEDEAVWTSALAFLAVFNETDTWANTELLVAAARALLREAGDVFDSLPVPGEELEEEAPAAEQDDEEEEDPDDEEEEEEEEEEPEDVEDAHANE